MPCENCGEPILDENADARLLRHSGGGCDCAVCEVCGERITGDDTEAISAHQTSHEYGEIMPTTYSRPADAVDPLEAEFHDGLSERAFQDKLVNFARNQGWRVYHTYDSRRNEAGFPDLVMCNGRFVYLVELKTDKGRVTKKQQAWLDDLDHSAMHVVRVWRPSDRDEFVRSITTNPRDPQPR